VGTGDHDAYESLPMLRAWAWPSNTASGRASQRGGRLVDEGTLRTTLADSFGPINAANLRRTHALIESSRAKGKIVLEGFSGLETGGPALHWLFLAVEMGHLTGVVVLPGDLLAGTACRAAVSVLR
jgi:Zinc-binding dehydrogenase